MRNLARLGSALRVLSLAACGTDGADDADGAAALSALVSTTAEPAGETCAHGGTKIEFGTDASRDGQLDASPSYTSVFRCLAA